MDTLEIAAVRQFEPEEFQDSVDIIGCSGFREVSGLAGVHVIPSGLQEVGRSVM